MPLVAESEIWIPAGIVNLSGSLTVPPCAAGVIVFVHGSGSSRFSPRNKRVARELQDAGFATLLFDLLTTDEANDRANVFDVGLLADRLIRVIEWTESWTAEIPLGLFGASTGAAAALVADARVPGHVRAIVSRGGRPDLADELLPRVLAPTLLIVGEEDTDVLQLNREAFEQLTCEKALKTVPNATHLFEEPGTLDTVVALATSWFKLHLGSVPSRAQPDSTAHAAANGAALRHPS